MSLEQYYVSLNATQKMKIINTSSVNQDAETEATTENNDLRYSSDENEEESVNANENEIDFLI